MPPLWECLFADTGHGSATVDVQDRKLRTTCGGIDLPFIKVALAQEIRVNYIRQRLVCNLSPREAHFPKGTERMDTKPDDNFAIAERFKALRQKAHMTQARLAKIVGICRQCVNEVENLRVKPHEATWNKFRELERKHEEGGKRPMSLNWLSDFAIETGKQKKATR